MRDHYGDALNFEHVLHALEMMDGLLREWGRPSPGSRRLVEGILCKEPSPSLKALFDERGFLSIAQRSLFATLHESFTRASGSATAATHWPEYREFWRNLDEAFDLTVVTLNYDTFADQALGLTGAEQGFGARNKEGGFRFDPRLLRSAPRRLLHLHGSILLGYPTPDDSDCFVFEDDWDDPIFFEDAASALRSRAIRSTSESQAGRRTTKGPFITGMNKPDKLLVEPYQTYFQVLSHQVQVCPRLLVLGYGFGDLHVNAVIDRMTRHHGSERRVASVTLNDPSDLQYKHRDEFGVVRRWAEEREPAPRDKPAGIWTSKNQLVRIDHRGLVAAVSATDRLVDFLLGAGRP